MTTGPSSETSPSGARESAGQGGAAAAVPPLAPGPARMVVLVGAVLALLTYLCGFFGAAALSVPITLIVGGGVLGLLALLPGVGRVLPAAVVLSVSGFLLLVLTRTSVSELADPGVVGWVAVAFGLLSTAALVGGLLLDIGLVAMPAPRPARDRNPAPQAAWGQPGYGPAPGQPGYGQNAPGGYPQQPGYGEAYPGQAGAFGQAPAYAPPGYGRQPGYGGYGAQGYATGQGPGQGAYGPSGYGAGQPGSAPYPGAPGSGQEPPGQQGGGSLFAAPGSGVAASQAPYGAAPTAGQVQGQPGQGQGPAGQSPAGQGQAGQGQAGQGQGQDWPGQPAAGQGQAGQSPAGQGQAQPGAGQPGSASAGAGQPGSAGSASPWTSPDASADATNAVPVVGQASREGRPETPAEGAGDETTHSFRPDADGKGSAG
ncbi:MAG: DUF5336 domain-containing protein [Pseudonocardia sp.]|nr:DUF5336 domain-containing protein [Pseudonocardia sp.]